MTAPAAGAWSAPPPGHQAARRILGVLAAVALPTVGSLLILRYLLPSRLEGAGRGLSGALAWMGDQYPLLVAIVLFVLLAEVGRYWLHYFRREVTATPSAGDAALTRRSVARSSVALIAVVAVAFVMRSSVVATFRVVGPSMLPTLEIGDRVLVNRLAYGIKLPFKKAPLRAHPPRRGDLVVFRANGLTGGNGPQSVVKRVLGVPGDRVQVQQGNVLINDWPVPACDAGPYVDLTGRLTVRGRLVVEYLGDKTYLTVRKPVETPFAGYTVKSGEVFVIGDDRGLSSDSRTWSEGRGTGVPTDMLEGSVTRVLLGARPDGRLDFSRLLAPPLDLRVRMPGIDMTKTDERIRNCLNRRPAMTTPPEPGR
jgi:signal peptidase I